MKVKRVKRHIEMSLNAVEAHQLRAILLHLSAVPTTVTGDTFRFVSELYDKVARETDPITRVDYGAIMAEVQ